jgi:hypothetical protein
MYVEQLFPGFFIYFVTDVQQDVILSLVFVDIICTFQASVYGCGIGGTFIGVLLYADYLLMLSPTCSDIRRMNVRCDNMKWLDMCFNVSSPVS